MIVRVREFEGWTCQVCNQSRGNTDEWGRCVVCNNERGDWLCDCGRRNRKTDDECSECGSPNPDSE